MKKQLITAIAMVMFSACVTKQHPPEKGKWRILYGNMERNAFNEHSLEIDSFDMASQNCAIIWIDGKSSKIHDSAIRF